MNGQSSGRGDWNANSAPRRSSSPLGHHASPLTTPMNTPPRRFSGGGNPHSGGSRTHQHETTLYSDRFIPSRSSTNLEDAMDLMENRDASRDQNSKNDVAHESQLMMNNLIRSELLGQQMPPSYPPDARMNELTSPSRKDSSATNVFKYRSSQGSGRHSHDGSLRGSLGSSGEFPGGSLLGGGGAAAVSMSSVQSPAGRRSLGSMLGSPKKPVRKISKTPYKILDAPALQDDYYLNLVDWSSNNVLSVALGSSVYLWSACTSKVTRLCDLGEDDSVTSISWATAESSGIGSAGNSKDSHLISVGTNTGKILIWDASTCQMVREMAGHESRVGTMAWSSSLLASGSRDRSIYLQDIRIRGGGGSSSSSGGGGSGGGSSGRSVVPWTPASTATTATTTTANNGRHSTGSMTIFAGVHGAGRGGWPIAAAVPDTAAGIVSNVTAAMHPYGATTTTTTTSNSSSISRSRRVHNFAFPSSVGGGGDDASGGTMDLGETTTAGSTTVSTVLSSSASSSLMDGGSDSVLEGGGGGQEVEVDFHLPPPPPPPLPLPLPHPSSSSSSSSIVGAPNRRGGTSTYRTSSASTTTTTTTTGGGASSSGTSPRRFSSPLRGNNNSSSSSSSSSSSNEPSVVRELLSHKQEVCGLKWSFDEKMLASGGNDNKLYVWESQQGRQEEPICRLEDHTAAVKAVAWSPHQHGLLVSGGGTADRHIRFWNALTSTPLHKIDTGSQVCNLMWSKNVNELVSTHGYSLNQVIVWKYPSMQKIATLTGHTLRVLYLAMSPDGQNIVTGAGDETLRFWNVFPGPRNRTGYRLGPSTLVPSGSDIR